MTKALLLTTIVILAVLFLARWISAARGGAHGPWRWPAPVQLLVGVVVNFFDTLGIGSLATTTTAFKALRMVPDHLIPGTMIVGLTLAVATQALIFITVVEIDTTLLALMIGTALTGGWLGAGVVSHLPQRPIQAGMGTALLVAAAFMALSQLGLMPGGGEALGLAGGRLVLALAVNFVLGALIMVGVGNYGPTFVLLSVLGMDPRAAFPIMMGSGAFAALLGGLRFLEAGRFSLRPAVGLSLGGIPAVLVAGLLVKSMPIATLRWVVVVVVAYAAFVMLRSALTPERNAEEAPVPPPRVT